MNFSLLADLFEELEGISSRNKTVDAIVDILKKANEENVGKICYFLLGEIVAGYKDVNLGLGNELVKSSISIASGVDVNEIEKKLRKTGDLGSAVEDTEFSDDADFKDVFEVKKPLKVKDIHKGLMKIATASGKGSQDIKKKTLASVIVAGSKKERKYVVRLAMGEMRLGVGAMTILDSLSVAFTDSKKNRSALEYAYNVSSDIGHVAEVLLRSGLEGVKHIRTAMNRPIRPMLAQRVDEMSEIREKISSELIAAEEKYDGERIQAHKNGDQVKLFSRRLTDVTNQFPDVVMNVQKYVSVKDAILDGEVVAYDFEKNVYRPFQELMQRRRKYDVEEYANKIPVKYMIFDVLYADRKSFLKKSYPERRNKVKEFVKNLKYIAVADRIVSSSIDDIDEYFQVCIEKGLEGIVCKSCASDSYYRAGAREWQWIKWKSSYASELSDTLDLVVVGAYSGKGKRGGTYGALLCAVFNKEKDVFQTMCKLGSGFSDKQLERMPDKLKKAMVDKKPARVEASKDASPDFWFIPKFVIEVKGANITKSPLHTANWNEEEKAGLSLRFPRFVRWREDKSPEEATTSSEVVQMYKG